MSIQSSILETIDYPNNSLIEFYDKIIPLVIEDNKNYILTPQNTYGPTYNWVANKLKFGNLLKEHYLFGNIDYDYDIVCPLEEKFLTSINYQKFNDTENFTHDFIDYSFRKLIEDVNKEKRRQHHYYPDSIFYNINIKKTFLSVDNLYDSLIEKFASSFKKFYTSSTELNNSIINPLTFINKFITFLENSLVKTSILKSTSVICYRNAFTDALRIDINNSTNRITLDSVYDLYFKDKNFHQFSAMCRVNGFLIDQVTPWVIYPDFSSLNMINNMEKFGVNPDNIYSTRYRKIYKEDLASLIKLFYVSYNLFLYNNEIFNPCPGIIKKRQPIQDFQKFIDLTGGYYTWIKIYAYIKHRELNSSVQQKEFDFAVQNAYTLMENNLYLDAVEIIHQLFKEEFISIIDAITNGTFSFVSNQTKKINIVI